MIKNSFAGSDLYFLVLINKVRKRCPCEEKKSHPWVNKAISDKKREYSGILLGCPLEGICLSPRRNLKTSLEGSRDEIDSGHNGSPPAPTRQPDKIGPL